jgi:hypothetical protein
VCCPGYFFDILYTINMCLVYIYYCPKCGAYKRNYRRWPKFCANTNCIKIHKANFWTLFHPCRDICEEKDCSAVFSKEKTKICPTCKKHIRDDVDNQWLDDRHAKRVLKEQHLSTIHKE